MGRHQSRTDLGRKFGATDIVAERGDEGVDKVRELTGGDGTHTVLGCVGLKPALQTAFYVVRNGGAVSCVGARQYDDVPADFGVFFRNITLTGGVAPARAYIDELRPDVLDGKIEPGNVFDRTVNLDDVTAGYQAMADRDALKVLVSVTTSTAPATWTAAELDQIGSTGEVDVATRRSDGSLRSDRIVWLVRLGAAVYVRSVNGVDAAWYRGVQTRHEGRLTAGRLHRDVAFVEAGVHAGDDSGLDDALDEVYRVKYGRTANPVAHITADTARATTLRIDPA